MSTTRGLATKSGDGSPPENSGHVRREDTEEPLVEIHQRVVDEHESVLD